MGSLSTIKNQNASITMSSREIAQLCEKQHAHVMRDIRNMLDELYPNMDSLDFKGVFIVKNPETGLTSEIRLPKRETMILVSGYRIDLRAKIIDRLEELENQVVKPKIPQTLSQALRLAAEQAEQIEQQNRLIAYQAPKVAFVEHYVETGTTKSLREVAKILKMPEKAMISRLIEDKFLYRQSGNLLPYQSAHSRDLFAVKTGTAEHGHNFTQTRVTSKGIEFIASRYASELML
ncbi:phage antirepressor KilAC domain-containing protein [Pasteurella langaaensis]|uniref:phage antirepressor KilAC domain-containing protein n=1 Tax=Alitibacter langaaensis TaxID=756 RepID=UPI001FB01E32|nr:phage regulatory protein/antirepressor Ant [Pasteurella langaaensis]